MSRRFALHIASEMSLLICKIRFSEMRDAEPFPDSNAPSRGWRVSRWLFLRFSGSAGSGCRIVIDSLRISFGLSVKVWRQGKVIPAHFEL